MVTNGRTGSVRASIHAAHVAPAKRIPRLARHDNGQVHHHAGRQLALRPYQAPLLRR
jgi:hypothetical protein